MSTKTADTENPSGSDAPGFFRIFGVDADWEDRVITTVAMTLGVTVVAAVAILMGIV